MLIVTPPQLAGCHLTNSLMVLASNPFSSGLRSSSSRCSTERKWRNFP